MRQLCQLPAKGKKGCVEAHWLAQLIAEPASSGGGCPAFPDHETVSARGGRGTRLKACLAGCPIVLFLQGDSRSAARNC